MEHVIVGGVRIVDGGQVVEGVAPGKGVRAPFGMISAVE
jgi:hypothetical protein